MHEFAENDWERPRYFHLLSDREIHDLRPALEILARERDAVLDLWHQRYVANFGGARTLDRGVFLELFGRELDAVTRDLLEADMEGFEADVRRAGHELVRRGVPFVEVVASIHLFEESATEHFKRHLAVSVKEPGIYITFDKLSHCRMILLASSYFEGHRADVAARIRGLESEAERLSGGTVGRTVFHGLVGGSQAMRRVYEQIAAAAGGRGAILVDGDSGVGKELVARAIHECRGGGDRPFVVVNCAALPRDLIESELFGHRKGAYTGALSESQGLVRASHGGTLFLDEITEMATETQAKLLRVIEERRVRPVGTDREVTVDVRFVAATNREPEAAVEEGVLRKDLFYRLSVHRIHVPALRERREDVLPLVGHFLEELGRLGLPQADGVSDEAGALLTAYDWPGNVRELRSCVEHALTFARDRTIGIDDLPPRVRQHGGPASGSPQAVSGGVVTFEQAERELIVRALEQTGGNKVQAARRLRISRHQLYDKLRKYEIA